MQGAYSLYVTKQKRKLRRSIATYIRREIPSLAQGRLQEDESATPNGFANAKCKQRNDVAE